MMVSYIIVLRKQQEKIIGILFLSLLIGKHLAFQLLLNRKISMQNFFMISINLLCHLRIRHIYLT